jgi:hypothetical protein
LAYITPVGGTPFYFQSIAELYPRQSRWAFNWLKSYYNRKACKYGQIDLIEGNDRSEGRLIDGPLCSFFVGDLGYAVGSATYIANRMMVDCRPLVAPSMTAGRLGICPDSAMVIAVAMASSAKNPFVDVCPDYHYLHRDKLIKQARKNYVVTRQVHWFDYRGWYPSSGTDRNKENEPNPDDEK